LEQVGREGLDLTFESYLYAAGMTHLAILLPVDVQAGGMDAMLARMQAPSVRERSLDHLRGELGHRGDQIVGYTGSGRFVGMTLAEAAEAEGKEWADFAYDLIMEEEGLETFVIPWTVSDSESEQIIEQTALHARHIVASDGVYGLPHPHPRGYGCFARVLRRFVRETGLLSLERAIHKMSGLPAQRFGLVDRGRVEVGAAADLVLFDPDLVADHSTWREPLKPATGVERVMVNGEWVIDGGLPTGRLPGRVLCRAA
jgi:N-acyl-D-amino-acid deacylase